jgi:hypothetical protein
MRFASLTPGILLPCEDQLTMRATAAPENTSPPVVVNGSLFLYVCVAAYDPRSGSGAVIREDTSERLTFERFFADRSFTPLTPGECVWCELSPCGGVVNLTRLH